MMLHTKEEIIKKAGKRDIEAYESIGTGHNAVTLVSSLHTDKCRFVENWLSDKWDVIDSRIIDGEDYNKTLLANCGEEIEDDIETMVVIVKRK